MASNRPSLAALCRMDRDLVDSLAGNRPLGPLLGSAALAILIGSALYGAVFGLWRSPLQAGLSAVKLPLLIAAVTASSALINGMLAQVLGAGLTFRQTAACIGLSLAISALLLGALSPVVLFFVWQAPPPDSGPDALPTYRFLLATHTALIGLCGIAGNVRAYRVLRQIPAAAPVAGRLLAAWITLSGLAGCELSWVLSPFLAKPGLAVPFINPDAFTGNFFEYLGRALAGTIH